MTIKYTGGIKTQKSSSVIYFIIYNHFIYIGETKDYTPSRWGSHLSKNGSFTKIVKEKTGEDINYNSQINFFSFEIMKEDLYLDKKELQALEHKLHLEYSSTPFIRGRHYELISDTTRTAPRKYNYKGLPWSLNDFIHNLKL